MLSESSRCNLKKLAIIIKEIKNFIVFTGAWISTESGIPDFRGPKGIWKKYRPIELRDFIKNPESRTEYWRRKLELYPQIKNA